MPQTYPVEHELNHGMIQSGELSMAQGAGYNTYRETLPVYSIKAHREERLC